jgi:ferredoxin, 2Fe-2S
MVEAMPKEPPVDRSEANVQAPGRMPVAGLDSEGSLITVQPSGFTFRAEPGETVMAAAIRERYKWPSVCGGIALCGACVCRLQQGAKNVNQVERDEADRLRELKRRANSGVTNSRLACQLVPNGPITVFKLGVRDVSVSRRGRIDTVHNRAQ